MPLPARIGFIGTGTITDAMVRGLLRAPAAVTEILVSPRNADVAAALAADFPAVRVAPHNQAIVDECDTVVLAVRPQVAEGVVRPLRFRDGQKVVSLIAASARPTLLDWIGAEVVLTQAVPLPFVARRTGVTAVYPPDADTAALFDVLGNAVECETKAEYDQLAAASALMATYFGILQTATDWLAGKGMAEEKGRAYLAPLFASLSETALQAGPETAFRVISREYATAGGLNEQVLRDFEENGGGRAITLALDRVLARITGS